MKQKFFFYTGGILLIIFSACTKDLPTASYTHNSDTYEEGDTIYFNSTSSNANNFRWDFGDGSTSTIENPWHVFDSTGSFDVSLKVTNDDGSDETTSTVIIKDPTILAFEVIKEETEELMPGSAIVIYDNKTEWENVSDNFIAGGYTDDNGYIEFYYAKAIVYYVYAFKEESGGIWIGGGTTSSLVLNQVNFYTIPTEWYPYEKKSADHHNKLIKLSVSKNNRFL
jgi:PKD repeat protein